MREIAFIYSPLRITIAILRTLHISSGPYVRTAHFLVRTSTLVHQTERDLINKLVQISVRAALRLTSTRSSIGAKGSGQSWSVRGVINARASIHAKWAHESERSWRSSSGCNRRRGSRLLSALRAEKAV